MTEDVNLIDVTIEILAIRKGMWTTIASRKHIPIKIFPFGNGASEVMLFGTVSYILKDGRKATVSFTLFWISLLERIE